ncbi:tRNA-splicing endonuclease subunit sen54 [Tulasnella sp. 408]|nr:tRNA-splicing endonuclease subunit sen54 [Tulasnella sp. 408]
MDDSLENPTIALPKDPVEDGIDDDDLDGNAADWANLPKGKVDITRPIIPKRGEKYFEPVGGPSALPNSGSGLQQHMLDKARSAMYSALKAERGVSSKTISYALWFPETGYAQVVLARGAAFGSLGYSNVRDPISGATKEKGKGKSLELLPEEALYMVERGVADDWATPLSKKAKAAAAAAARQAKREARQPPKSDAASPKSTPAPNEDDPLPESTAADTGAGTGMLAYFASFFSASRRRPHASPSIKEPSSQITRNATSANPFAALKNGKKNFVVAVVDNGSTSFIR